MEVPRIHREGGCAIANGKGPRMGGAWSGLPGCAPLDQNGREALPPACQTLAPKCDVAALQRGGLVTLRKGA